MALVEGGKRKPDPHIVVWQEKIYAGLQKNKALISSSLHPCTFQDKTDALFLPEQELPTFCSVFCVFCWGRGGIFGSRF